MASLQDLAGTAQQILAKFTAQLETQGLNLPARRYVSPTPVPVWDGEQFTVALAGVGQGEPGIGVAQSFGGPRAIHFFAQFSVSIVREVSVLQTSQESIGIPPADVMNKDGIQSLTDAAALIEAATVLYDDYSLTGPGESFEIGQVQPLGPDGGLAAQRLLISLSLT